MVPINNLRVGSWYRYVTEVTESTDNNFTSVQKASGPWQLLGLEETPDYCLLTVRFVDQRWTATLATRGPGWTRKFFLVDVKDQNHV